MNIPSPSILASASYDIRLGISPLQGFGQHAPETYVATIPAGIRQPNFDTTQAVRLLTTTCLYCTAPPGCYMPSYDQSTARRQRLDLLQTTPTHYLREPGRYAAADMTTPPGLTQTIIAVTEGDHVTEPPGSFSLVGIA